MEVLPVGAGSKARRRDLLWLVIELADGTAHGAKCLSLVFDSRALGQLKSGDLILDKRHAASEEPTARVLDHERGMMQGAGTGRVRPAEEREENCGTRNREPQSQA